MRKIYLTERDIQRMVVESLQTLLCESAVNNNRKKAKHYVFNFLQTNTNIADELKQVLNQQNITHKQDENDNIYYQTNGGTFLPFNEYIFQNIITELNLGRFGGGANTTIDNAQYDLGLVRMYIQDGWVKHRQDTYDKLSQIVQLLKNSPHFFKNIEGFNLQDFSNNWTLDQTYEVCKDEFKKLSQNYKQQYSELGISNLRQDYKIIPIRSTEEASKYKQYTSWCICERQDNYDGYAGKFGIFYFCLQNGFENVPEQPGDNCPLDEYGLSMIAVCVTQDGMIKNVTCRWNHSHGAGDQVMGVEELSRYFNADPSQIFPPRSKEELVAMGYYPLDNVIEDVKRGDYSRLRFVDKFNNGGVYCVNDDKYVIVANNQVFNNQWFDYVGFFDDNGITTVQLNDKETWFSSEKQDYLFPNLWFDSTSGFDDNGIAIVKLNGKKTWFSLEKQDYLFPNLWFDRTGGFDDNGIAIVQLNDKQTWFSLEKQDYLFPNKWFDFVGTFNDKGIAIVELNNKQTWFSLEKQDYLFPNQWFDWLNVFDSNGIAKVKLNDKYNFFSMSKGQVLSRYLWFDEIISLTQRRPRKGSITKQIDSSWYRVRLNGKKYYFTLDGQLLDYDTIKPLSDEELQSLQKQQLVSEMVNRLVKNYLI